MMEVESQVEHAKHTELPIPPGGLREVDKDEFDEIVVIAPARQEGRDAYFAGVVGGDVPYDECDGRHWEWLQGWSEAGLAAIVAKRRRDNKEVSGGRSTSAGLAGYQED